jgi:hypothetical protein
LGTKQIIWGGSGQELGSGVGADVEVGEGEDVSIGRRSTSAMNVCGIAFWKTLRVSCTTVLRYSSIIVF